MLFMVCVLVLPSCKKKEEAPAAQPPVQEQTAPAPQQAPAEQQAPAQGQAPEQQQAPAAPAEQAK